MKHLGSYLALALALLFSTHVFIITTTSRETFVELSSSAFGPNSPLMNSWFLDIFLRPATGYAVAVIAIAVLIKEFFLKPFRRRLILNLLALVGFAGLSLAFVWSLYAPALTN